MLKVDVELYLNFLGGLTQPRIRLVTVSINIILNQLISLNIFPGMSVQDVCVCVCV